MKEPNEQTVSLPADFYTLRVEVSREGGRDVWRAFRQWRSAELPDFVLFEEAKPAAVAVT